MLIPCQLAEGLEGQLAKVVKFAVKFAVKFVVKFAVKFVVKYSGFDGFKRGVKSDEFGGFQRGSWSLKGL
ncbi:hypothetical protein E4U41_007796 [Claviceps citrina]|nr:hypothetical protein E4U41_007796 [Claviceps citrina]